MQTTCKGKRRLEGGRHAWSKFQLRPSDFCGDQLPALLEPPIAPNVIEGRAGYGNAGTPEHLGPLDSRVQGMTLVFCFI